MRLPRPKNSVLLATGLAALFLANSAARLYDLEPEQLFLTWRAYDDFAIAAGYAARASFPVAPYRVRDFVRRDRDPRFRAFKERMLAGITDNDLRSHAFWRTFPAGSITPDGRWLLAKRFDDTGRALFLGMAFKALDGAAPFLLFWLAVLAAVPVLIWIVIELSALGYGLAGVIFVALLSGSAFVLDMLALGYSTAGFHLLGILVLVPLAAHVVLGRPTVRGLLARAAATGVLLGICGLCRGTMPLLMAGYGLALAIGCWRVGLAPRPGAPGQRARRIALGAIGLALLLLPYAGLRAWSQGLVGETRTLYQRGPAPQYHDAALLFWKGLGDFDRSKGYEFRDKAGEKAIMRVDPQRRARRDSEVLLREIILNDIRQDPLWLADILARRVLATVTQHKLSPWTPRDGVSATRATSPNEGVMDNYYGLTRQADWIAVGSWSGEMPLSLLLAPTAALLVFAGLPVGWKRSAQVTTRARRSLPILACVAAAVLPTPVLITTATALETECFVIVHFLGWAFLGEALLRRDRTARPQVTVGRDVAPSFPEA